MKRYIAALLLGLIAVSAGGIVPTKTPIAPVKTPTATPARFSSRTATATPTITGTRTPTPAPSPTPGPAGTFSVVFKAFRDSGYVVPASNYTVLVDPTDGTTVIKLSAAPHGGQIINIKSIAAGTVTIDKNGLLIEGANSNISITTPLQSYTLQYDGVGSWWIE